MPKQNFTKEERLLLLVSRIDLNDGQKKEVESIIEHGVDMNHFVNLAIKHKVLPLASQHLIRHDSKLRIGTQHKRLIDHFYLGNRARNRVVINELRTIVAGFQNLGLKAVPLKGAVIVPAIYKDPGLRIMNDLDFLIDGENKSVYSKALKSMGYIQGYYDWTTNDIKPVPRKKLLMWNLHLGNMFPHIKKIADEFCRFVIVDFSYDVDLKKNYKSSKLLLDESFEGDFLDTKSWLLTAENFVIHLCIHLYKEATNLQYVYINKDLNLIKFCDLREYILANLSKINWEFFNQQVEKLDAKEAVYFSFHFLNTLYEDEFIERILDRFEMADTGFLNYYGYNDFESPRAWKKNFLERFFSLDNTDEIEENSKLMKYRNLLDGNSMNQGG